MTATHKLIDAKFAEYRMQNIQKAALAEWLLASIPADLDLFFLTLTMKQGLQRDDLSWQRISRESADQNAAFFLKELHKKVLKHAFKKYGKKLFCIDVSHGPDSSETRFHRHMLIEKPARFTDEEFEFLIRESWRKSLWNYHENQIERARAPSAVVRYMIQNDVDNVCINNTNLRASPDRRRLRAC